MNGTTQAGAGRATAPATVAEYAARVREHLAGMPAEQVDDLTDGLEADLADALADEVAPAGTRGDLIALFGPPADYARELRVAAGLPEPEAAPARLGLRARLRGMRGDVRRTALRATAGIRRQPWWPGVREFGVAVRPLWWVLRAWVVYQLLLQLAGGRYANGGGKGGWVPADFQTWLLLTGLVVVSVQWGRGLWLPRSGRWLPTATGVLAVVLLVPAVIWAGNGAVRWQTQYDTAYVEQPYDGVPREDGVWVDGMQVSNLFVYDAEGNPLTDVQVYDDRGRPVHTTSDGGWSSYSLPGVDEQWNFVAARDEDGRVRWNVYPLLGAPYEEFDWEGFTGADSETPSDVLTTDPRVPPRPFAKAPAVVDRRAAEEPAAEPPAGPSAAPSTDPSTQPADDPAAAGTAAQSSTRDGGPGDTAAETEENAATTAP